MIDKRVLSVDYGPIRKGMLVLPRSTVGMGAIPTNTLWAGPKDAPGLVLELVPHYNEGTGAITPTALVLVAGKRVQIGTRYIRPAPENEHTEEL